VLKSRHTVGSINHTEPKTEQIRKKGLKTKNDIAGITDADILSMSNIGVTGFTKHECHKKGNIMAISHYFN